MIIIIYQINIFVLIHIFSNDLKQIVQELAPWNNHEDYINTKADINIAQISHFSEFSDIKLCFLIHLLAWLRRTDWYSVIVLFYKYNSSKMWTKSLFTFTDFTVSLILFEFWHTFVSKHCYSSDERTKNFCLYWSLPQTILNTVFLVVDE